MIYIFIYIKSQVLNAEPQDQQGYIALSNTIRENGEEEEAGEIRLNRGGD